MKYPELISTFIQTFASVVAIVISVVNLWWSTKSQRDANKPYIIANLQKVTINSTSFTYLVIKNYGKTAANITKVKADPEIKSGKLKFDNNPFSKFTSQLIAPNQAYAAAVSIKNSENELETREFDLTIEYVDGRNKKQSNKFHLNEIAFDDSKHFGVAPLNKNEIATAIYKTASEKIVSHLED